jgi:hypothetical protein
MPKRADLVLEYRHEGNKNWAMRFYQDGLVEEYSDTRMEFKDGDFVSHEIPLAWRELTHLIPDEYEQVVGAIRKVDFFQLPERIGAREVKDGILFIWTAHLDGHTRTVEARGSAASAHPALKQLSQMVQEVTGQAFKRQAPKK